LKNEKENEIKLNDSKCTLHTERGLVWGDFPSLYSRFYKVIMLASTNATGEGKNVSAILDVRLRL
jgi:hypothetical protein